MSKELSPLEALEKLTNYKCSCMSEKIKCKEVIETALKISEYYKMLCEVYIYFIHDPDRKYSVLELGKTIKALEIIKEKEVNVFIFLHSGDLETYNDMVEDNRKLTNVEYDLLKEALL